MTVYWPFERARAGGWAFGEVLTSAQMNVLDANVEQAADGALWADTLIAKNWVKSQELTGATALAYGKASSTMPHSIWRAFGASDAAYSWRGGGDWSTDSTIAALPATPKCAVTNDLVALVGGDPGGASAQKIARSTTGLSGTYAAVNSVDTGTAVVDCLVYFNSLYIAGLSDGGIETSPDGSAWTDRTVPNANARKQFVTDGSILLCLTSATTDKYITSTDGITWTERSFPASKAGWRGVYFNDTTSDGFYIISQAASPVIYHSNDGITWATVTPDVTFSSSTNVLVSYRRVLVLFNGINVYYSYDGGSVWSPGGQTGGPSSVPTDVARYGDGRIVMLDDNDFINCSLGFTL